MIRLLACILVFALGVISTDSQAAPARNIGVVKDVNAAFGTSPGGELTPKRLDDGVVLKEAVETLRDGALQLDLIDETTLWLGSESKVILDELVFDANSRSGSSTIKFAKGAYFWVTGQIATKEQIALETPVATIGIRGTEFSLKITPDGGTQVAVIDGLVELKSKTTGLVVSIPAGHNADVSALGRVSTLRLGTPRTGDSRVDAIVAKAEERVIQTAAASGNQQAAADAKDEANEARATAKDARDAAKEAKVEMDDGAKTAAKETKADAKDEAKSTPKILPVKANMLKTAAVNDYATGPALFALDRSTPISITSMLAHGIPDVNAAGAAKEQANSIDGTKVKADASAEKAQAPAPIEERTKSGSTASTSGSSGVPIAVNGVAAVTLVAIESSAASTESVKAAGQVTNGKSVAAANGVLSKAAPVPQPAIANASIPAAVTPKTPPTHFSNSASSPSAGAAAPTAIVASKIVNSTQNTASNGTRR